MTELIPVESSNVAAVGYDPATDTLYVEFIGGALYAYADVPPEIHVGLMTADSKGRYLNAVIKGVYPYRKIELLEEAA